jgi:hypothetical protein
MSGWLEVEHGGQHLQAPPGSAAAATLGWELIREDPEAGTVEIAFHPGEASSIRTAPCRAASSRHARRHNGPRSGEQDRRRLRPREHRPERDFHPRREAGPRHRQGTVVSQGRTIAFLEGELFDEAGNLLARATSSARIVTVG